MHKYYCNKCKKYHHRGKFYKDHLNYKKEKRSKNSHKDQKDEEINFNLDDLRPIAQRQLTRLYKKMKVSGNHELYRTEIVKLIKKENKK